jgi:MFS family permease
MADRTGGRKNSGDTRTEALPGPGVAFRLSPVILWLGIVSMATDISSESVSAILPLYVTGFLGLSTIAFGFIDGLNQGVSAVVRIAAGWASDRTGHPKRVAVAGYGLSMLARAGFLFAAGFWAITGIVTGDRIGKGIRTAPRDALISSAAQPEHLARSFGVHRMLDTVGAATGPLLAFLILLVIPNGFSAVFVVSLAFAVIGVAILVLVVPDRRTPRTAQRPDRARRPFKWSQLKDAGLTRLLVTAGILALLTVGDGFIYLVLQARDSFAVQWFPLLYVGTNVVYLVLAVPLGRLADRWGRLRVFLGGHGALLACYLLAAVPFGGLGVTAACLVLLGVFYAATDGVLAALASQLVSPDKVATGIGAAQTVVALCRMAASAGFGILWFAVGASAAMTMAAVGLAAGLVAAAVLMRTSRAQEAGA